MLFAAIPTENNRKKFHFSNALSENEKKAAVYPSVRMKQLDAHR